MQANIPFLVKFLPARYIFFLLCIPPLSTGYFPYRPLLVYKCIRVIDGDTVVLKRGDKKIRVRLSFIDAPEVSQLSFDKHPVGIESKNYLEKLVLGKKVYLKSMGKDIYKRQLGEIIYQKKSINLLMLKNGYALYYDRKIRFRYIQAESIAKLRRLGIWKSDGFISPWRYRKMK